MSVWGRWWRFNAVGAAGFVVQLAALAFFVEALGWEYRAATAAAVECALLHNFFWHRRWTWRDRPRGQVAHRLLRFHLTTGTVSVAGNLALMWLLAGKLGIPYLAANALAVGACALANFAAGDRAVFAAIPSAVREPESPQSEPSRPESARFRPATEESPAR